MVSFPYNDVTVTFNDNELSIDISLIDEEGFLTTLYFRVFDDTDDFIKVKAQILDDLKKKQIQFTLDLE